MYRDGNGVVKDTFDAYLVEGAKFTIEEEYPVIEEEMVSNYIPKKVMPFHVAINSRMDLSDVFIDFFEDDDSFKRVKRNPKLYLNFFKRTAGIIGLDFSVHTDMPLVKQKAQMNDNLSLTYYYAKNGIPVIPNIRYGIDETKEDFFAAIPKGRLVALGTNGFTKHKYQKADIYCSICDIIKYLNPNGIIIVGPLDKNIYNELSDKVIFYHYNAWSKDNCWRNGND